MAATKAWTSRTTARRTRQTTPPRLNSHLRRVATATTAALTITACGSTEHAPALQVVPSASLAPGRPALVRPLPEHWTIAFEVRFAAPRDELKIGLGSNVVTIFDGGHDWHHVKLTQRMLSVDGRSQPLSAGGGSNVSLRATGGEAVIRSLRITAGASA